MLSIVTMLKEYEGPIYKAASCIYQTGTDANFYDGIRR